MSTMMMLSKPVSKPMPMILLWKETSDSSKNKEMTPTQKSSSDRSKVICSKNVLEPKDPICPVVKSRELPLRELWFESLK